MIDYPEIEQAQMALSDTQAIIEQINNAKHILVTGKQDHDGDVIAGSLALFLVLQKLDKKVDIAFTEYQLPETYKFLPTTSSIKKELGELQRLTIKINTKETTPGELSYEKKDGELHIHITPKNGTLQPKDISTETSQYKYDLVFVLGSPDLESLGGLYLSHPDFFYKTPVINIDHSANNEQFGQINAIDLNASSVSEMLYHIMDTMDPGLIDDGIATCLYTGMTVKTRSFRVSNLTPNTLHVASKLITQGADREKIINHLYRTKSVNTLKLWGRALARLEYDAEHHIAWTQLTSKDFTLTHTKPRETEGLIEELMAETPDARVVVLLYEDIKATKVYVYTTQHHNALQLTREYEPQGNKQFAKIVFPSKPLLELQEELLASIRKYMKQ